MWQWRPTLGLRDVLAWGVFTASQNVPEAPREPANAGPLAGGCSDLRRVGPSTRGATAPQGAQRRKPCSALKALG